MANNPIRKWFTKSWCIKNFYRYDIYEVYSGKDMWYMAEPKTPGVVTRTAENEKVLKIILENDCESHIRFQKQNHRTR